MSRRHKYAAEHGAMVRRLVELYRGADPANVVAGRRWYPEAEAIVRDLAADHAVSTAQAAAVIAALSPQTKWRENIVNAAAILAGRPCPNPTYRINERKASEVVAGADPDTVLGGPKVRAFFGNLTGLKRIVTVDVWAQRAATGRDLAAPKVGRYGRIAKAYQAAADRVGEHPRDFQATIWLTVRPGQEHSRDTETIGDLFA